MTGINIKRIAFIGVCLLLLSACGPEALPPDPTESEQPEIDSEEGFSTGLSDWEKPEKDEGGEAQ